MKEKNRFEKDDFGFGFRKYDGFFNRKTGQGLFLRQFLTILESGFSHILKYLNSHNFLI